VCDGQLALVEESTRPKGGTSMPAGCPVPQARRPGLDATSSTTRFAMPATPEEMKRLVDAFEDAHAPVARAMADLLVRGNILLEDYQMREGPVGDAFEAFVFSVLHEHGIRREAFAKTLVALNHLRETIDHLDRLPS